MKKEELLRLAEEKAVKAIEVRRAIHQDPELSGKEFRTCEKICKELDRLGIEYKTWPGYTGVAAVIMGPQPGPVIGMRADIDALPITEFHTELPYCSKNPGVMHACGHDIHTAVQLGAAALLKDLQPHLKGGVKFIFQPAEEATDLGASHFIELGCMEDPKMDAIYSLHVDDTVQAGTVGVKKGTTNSASDIFYIKVKGKSAHGTRPQNGIDAIYTACQMIMSLYGMTARRLSALENVSVNVGKIQGGTANNIIAEEAEFGISLRTVKASTREFMHNEIKQLLNAVAAENKAEVEIEEYYGCASQVNDDGCFDLVCGLAEKLYGKDHLTIFPEPSMGSEDFSAYGIAGNIPSIQWGLGIAHEDKSLNASLHNSHLMPNEDAIKVGIAMQAGSVLQLIGGGVE